MIRSKRSKNSKSIRAPPKTKSKLVTLPNPPTFDGNVNIHKRFRFRNTATGVTLFTIQPLDLFYLLGVGVSGDPNMFYPIIRALRIRSVSIWSTVNLATGETYPIKIIPIIGSAGNIGQKPQDILDTPVGTAESASITWRPPLNSAADTWQEIQSGVATGGASFQLVCPQFAVIDVVLDLVLSDRFTSTLQTTTVSGIGAGVFFYNSLDSLSSSDIVPYTN